MLSWREIERFCRRDGWEEFKKKGRDSEVNKIHGDGGSRGHMWKKTRNKQGAEN